MIVHEKKFMNILFERGESKDSPNIKIFPIECKIAVNRKGQVKVLFACRY